MTEKGNYVFPDKVAKKMIIISQRTLYEAEILSIVFILVGLIAMGIYIIFFTNSNLFIKIMTGVNAGAGFFFLSTRMVTSFQAYREYLAVAGIIEDTFQYESERRSIKNG